MSAKRYECGMTNAPTEYQSPTMHQDANGGYVSYEDYAALEARCAALAVENVLLKKSEPAPFSKLMMDALDVYQAGADEVPELAILSAYKKLRDGLKIPATDAFLAEVRAAAVDEVCLKISNAIINCYQDEQIGLDAAATICGDFAAQLRKGVQS